MLKTQEARSGDPAIRRSGDPAIRHYTKGSSLNPCQPLRETIFRAPGDGRNRRTQRADRMSSFVEDGHRDLSEPVARLARTARKSAERRLFRLAYRMPNTQRRQVSRVLESQRALVSTRRRDAFAGIGRHRAAGLSPDTVHDEAGRSAVTSIDGASSMTVCPDAGHASSSCRQHDRPRVATQDPLKRQAARRPPSPGTARRFNPADSHRLPRRITPSMIVISYTPANPAQHW